MGDFRDVEIEEDYPDGAAIADDDPDFAEVEDGGDEDGNVPSESGSDDAEPAEFVGFERQAGDDSALVRQLRKKVRDLQQGVKQQERAAEPEIEVGEKPKFEDYDWDADKFQADLGAWHDRAIAAERQKAQRERVQDDQQREVERINSRYTESRSRLRYSDLEDAEETAKDALTREQQLIIAKYATNPALFMYALGRSPGKLAEVSATTDFIELGMKIRGMEEQLKPQRPKPPAPETRVRGRAPNSSGKQEARMLEQAEKNGGDMTALAAFYSRQGAK